MKKPELVSLIKEIILEQETEETVAEHMAKMFEASFATRLEKLKEIKAPEIMISQIEKNLQFVLTNDPLTAVKELVGCKEPELFNAIFISSETKTGNGGKKYAIYQTSMGELNYFPNARFGRWLTRKGVK
jgi:restriction endonuclease Mrr